MALRLIGPVPTAVGIESDHCVDAPREWLHTLTRDVTPFFPLTRYFYTVSGRRRGASRGSRSPMTAVPHTAAIQAVARRWARRQLGTSKREYARCQRLLQPMHSSRLST